MNLVRLKQNTTPYLLRALGLCLLALSMGRAAVAQTESLDDALSAAIFHGDLKTAATLVERGADPNGRDRDGVPVLFLAAVRGDLEAVTLLLDRGAEVDARDQAGDTALMATVWWSQIDVSGPDAACAMTGERLLARGADINAQNNLGMTALMYAAGWEHQPALQMLLEHGADVHLRDRMGRTALTWAARKDIKSTYVQALLQHGATVRLLDAILLYDRAATQRLFAGKPDLTVRDGNGETALMVAAERGDLPLVRALLAKGANRNTRTRGGLTALMLAFAGRELHWIPGGGTSMSGDPKEPDRLPIIRALLNAGAQVNARDALGHTPLLWALKVSTPEAVRSLLEAGADVNWADTQGMTPLMTVLKRRQGDETSIERHTFWYAAKELAADLIARGANVNAQDRDGNTALHQVVDLEPADSPRLALLLEHDADVNRRNRLGQTPLMVVSGPDASDAEKTALAQRLLAHGADPFARDRFGATALTYAAMGNDQALMALLREKGVRPGLIDVVSLRDAPTVRSLLAAGAHANARIYFETALMMAVKNADVETVRALLAKGADPNARDQLGIPILIMAVRGEATDTLDETASTDSLQTPSHPEIVRALLAGQANVNAASRWNHVTPLMLAAGLGQTDIVRLLLAHGANVKARNSGDSTALDYAQKYGHRDVAELLKQYGAHAARR